MSLHGGENALTFLSHVKQLAATSKLMNVVMENKEIAMAVLHCFPSNYETLIIALDAVETEESTFSYNSVKS